MSEHASYVVCGSKSWNRDLFDAELSKFSGEWHFLESKESLTLEFLESIGPRYVFFLHWSWIVPEKIVQEFECVNFHMTDLPYGRGGSPLQNLILRGHTETKLTAHRMVKELDAGEGVLILTDIYGGTPSNMASKLLIPGKVDAVAGVSLPMLIRVLTYRDRDLPTIVTKAISGGCEGVLRVPLFKLHNAAAGS